MKETSEKVLGKLPSKKIAPNSKSNPNPYPNRGAIFQGQTVRIPTENACFCFMISFLSSLHPHTIFLSCGEK